MRVRHDDGVSLVGLVVMLGVLIAVLMTMLFAIYNKGTSGSDLAHLLPTTSTTSTVPQGSSTTTTTSGVSALTAACTADYATANLAVAAYEDRNGTPPPPGSSWATARSKGGPFLQSWPRPEGATIQWTGSTLVVQPAHGASSAGPGTASPPTGCYAR